MSCISYNTGVDAILRKIKQTQANLLHFYERKFSFKKKMHVAFEMGVICHDPYSWLLQRSLILNSQPLLLSQPIPSLRSCPASATPW